jgi:hypothetical protein
MAVAICFYKVYKHNKTILLDFKNEFAKELSNRANVSVEKDVKYLDIKYCNFKNEFDNFKNEFDNDSIEALEFRGNLLKDINDIKNDLDKLNKIDANFSTIVSKLDSEIKSNKNDIVDNRNKILDVADDISNVDETQLEKIKQHFDDKIRIVVDNLEDKIDKVDDFYYIEVGEEV